MLLTSCLVCIFATFAVAKCPPPQLHFRCNPICSPYKEIVRFCQPEPLWNAPVQTSQGWNPMKSAPWPKSVPEAITKQDTENTGTWKEDFITQPYQKNICVPVVSNHVQTAIKPMLETELCEEKPKCPYQSGGLKEATPCHSNNNCSSPYRDLSLNCPGCLPLEPKQICLLTKPSIHLNPYDPCICLPKEVPWVYLPSPPAISLPTCNQTIFLPFSCSHICLPPPHNIAITSFTSHVCLPPPPQVCLPPFNSSIPLPSPCNHFCIPPSSPIRLPSSSLHFDLPPPPQISLPPCNYSINFPPTPPITLSPPCRKFCLETPPPNSLPNFSPHICLPPPPSICLPPCINSIRLPTPCAPVCLPSPPSIKMPPSFCNTVLIRLNHHPPKPAPSKRKQCRNNQ